MFNKSEKDVPVSAVTATSYVRRMVELETRGSGDTEGAMRRLEQRYGLPFWSMWYLRQGRAKSVDADLFARIRGAYLTYCENKITALQAELATEKAIEADADLEALEIAARDLAAKVAEAKARRLVARARA